MPDDQIGNNTESPRKAKKKGCGCLVFIVIVVLVIIASVTSLNEPAVPTQTGTSSSTPTTKAPAIIEKVLIGSISAKYEYGMFKVVGVAANGGNTELFSPTIVLEVYDETGKVKLDEQYAWPAGWFLKNVKPGEQAAFEIIAMPAGKPDTIKWMLYVKDYPYEIVKGKEK